MTFKNKIILDCDPGEDDALAILLALAKNIHVAALVCGYGNTSVDKTYKNGAGLLTLAGREDVPLFQGSEKPYKPHPLEKEVVSAGDFVGENGLCGIDLPVAAQFLTCKQSQEERIQIIAEHIRAVGPLTYIVTGPCTTFALILDILGDEAPKYIKKIIMMGGALDAAGNTGPVNPQTRKPYAEFNFYCDPHAVERIFKCEIPFILVPWDLTEKIVLKYEELKDWSSKTPEGEFVLNLMKNFLLSYGNIHQRSFEFNDCITITAFEEQGSFKKEKVQILLEGNQGGRIVRDERGFSLDLFDLKAEDILPTRNRILNILGVDLKDNSLL